jgi:tetratricopeptide (TPR) repeat protein
MNLITLALSACCLLLGGCASTPSPSLAPPAALFHDAGFAPPSTPINADGLFTLDAAMLRYAHSPAFTARLRERGPDLGLIDALYKKGELRLEYDASRTRTAAETFDARSGNCLSLVLMTAAFAKELGLKVAYQSVAVDPEWSRKGELYFASTHVNLSLGRRHNDPSTVSTDDDRMLLVDFLPPADMAKFHSYPLEEGAIVAMYLNNRAAEAMAEGQVDDAYWWAKAAVLRYPSIVLGFNTLGVVYHRRGDDVLAERAFKTALDREPENLAVMRNLVPVLDSLGKTAERDGLTAQLARIEPFPPFHYFDLGKAAMARQDFAGAKIQFERELKRAPYNHEFHFWLARAKWQLGDAGGARDQLRLAIETSTTREGSEAYSAKLDHLRGLAPLRKNAY